MEEPKGKAAGGLARASALSPAERSRIAKGAASARWAIGKPQEIKCGSPDSPLVIGDFEIECYVLEDGTRVITQSSILTTLGRHQRAAGVEESEQDLDMPPILRAKAIREFMTPELREQAQPIAFRSVSGKRASGYRAEILPALCDLYLAARSAKVLPANQAHIAQRAELLMRGLAYVGIIALVDEATGYQDIRAKDALSRILEAYVDKELQPWLVTFPPAFYREMFRLRDVEFPDSPVKKPQYFGHLTNDVVYSRLAPGVKDELKRVQRKSDAGIPQDKMFQRLSSNLGYPKLREHLGAVVALMRISNDWPEFMRRMDIYYPKFGKEPAVTLWEDDNGFGL